MINAFNFDNWNRLAKQALIGLGDLRGFPYFSRSIPHFIIQEHGADRKSRVSSLAT